MLGSLACLGLLTLLVDVKARLAVQTHAAELHSRTIDCIVSGHDNSLLLFLHAAVEARAPSGGGGSAVGADSESANGWAADRRLLLAGNGCEVTRIG